MRRTIADEINQAEKVVENVLHASQKIKTLFVVKVVRVG
jgi:hypothetical protein